MAGHSKWHNIKNAKEKSDAQRGKIFTKIGRELAVAVKIGGADPNNNNKLRDVIAKARQANMPNEAINRNIKKASGESGTINYEECLYEGYGVGGSAVMIECLTDSKNRTVGEVRHAFDKFGGSLGTSGSVQFMFDQKGVLIVDKTDCMTIDDILLLAIEADAEDVQEDEDVIEIFTAPEKLKDVELRLKKSGLQFLSAEVEYIPQNYIELSEEQLAVFNKMLEKLNESDDVQNVVHNVSNANN